MTRYDVIVVGGGPVGSYVAHRLAGMSYQVAVAEQRESLGEPVCCAGIVSQECVSAFAIDEDIILRRANSATLVSPSRKRLRLWREETQACIIDRAGLNLAMARRAQGSGVEYLMGSLVRDIEIQGDGVVVRATCRGDELNLEARAVVITTGFGSGLIQRAGLGRVGDFITGTQAEVEVSGVDEIEVYFGQEVAPGFFAWLVPTVPNRALVGLLSRRQPKVYLHKLMAFLKAEGKIVSGEVEPVNRGISLKPLAKTCADRLLVVGDAAGQVKPTTGGGIYYGLLCADIAAHHLRRALESGDLSARSLAGYEREWKRKLGWELKVGHWARKFYERLSDAKIDQAFDIMKSRGITEAFMEAKDLTFDRHGEVVLRLIGRKVLSKIGLTKLPSRLRRND